MTFDDIVADVRRDGPRRVALAGQAGGPLAEALSEAYRLGISETTICDDAVEAVHLLRTGRAEVLMKGTVSTREFMHAVLDREAGLRTGRLVSHVALHEIGGRLLLVTDAGIVPHPTLEQKVAILENALPVARALGIERPRVAALAGSEVVDAGIPESVDAAALADMAFEGCDVQGPMALDVAVNPEAARLKGIDGPVSGRADILLAPSVVVGNVFCKGLMQFTDCRTAGVLAGLSHPVALLSRSDTLRTRLDTLALGVRMAQWPANGLDTPVKQGLSHSGTGLTE